jgi:hypothetical protein
MKTPIAITLAALALATANTASAYSWSADKTSVKLRGTLTLTPNEGGQPFKCLVVMDLKTKRSIITAVKFPKNCNARFTGLPWNVDILTENSGGFAGGTFVSGNGDCVTGSTEFTDSGSGIWTLASGQCLSGTLTSNPPVTIVP